MIYTLLYIVAIYLIGSFVVATTIGVLLKRARCKQNGVSWREDSRLQDEAQLQFLRSRRSM